MILPRADSPTDPCPPGHASCLPYNPGTSTVTPDNHISYLPKFGPKRYIGITVVIVLVLAVLVWWWLARRRRRRRAAGSNPESNIAEVDSPLSETAMNSAPKRSWFSLGKRKSLTMSPPNPPDSEEKPPPEYPPCPVDSVTKEPRWMSESRVPKGLVKEVSGGMVVYTNGSKSSSSNTEPRRPKSTVPPPRDRISRSANLDSDWHFEHLHGVRYEVSKRSGWSAFITEI